MTMISPQPSSNRWAEQLIQEYKEGASDVEVASALNITMDKFQQQYKEVLVFRQLVDLGRMLSTAWWYKQGRVNLNNKAFNNVLWIFNMKNRQGWAEKTESTTNDVPIDQRSLDELQGAILAKMPGVLKRLGIRTTDAKLLEATSVEG